MNSETSSQGNAALIDWLRAQIASRGPMTFCDFMQAALYHPQHGYYTSGRAVVGRRGDFFTNVSVGALFGRLLARQFAEMWERLGRPPGFKIVEQGANNGDFARDALLAARAEAPEFFDALRYAIVEPFEILRQRQRETLGEFAEGKVAWRESLAALEPFTGVHFSNELIDAMPVHLVVFQKGAWREKYVCVSNGGFTFYDGGLSSDQLRAQIEKIAPPPIEGYTTEVNLHAMRWMDELAEKLTRGFALVIDYGWPREVFYDASRTRGTLACRRRHRRSDDPLQNIGDADLTAHVEFTSLVERAEARAFALAGFTDQHHFMVGLGARFFPDEKKPDQAEMRAFKTLMHPGLLGQSFKVLALQKNVAEGAALSGFQFAAHPRSASGLR